MDKFIPYGRQDINKQDKAAVLAVLDSDYITQGPKIREFEAELCRYTGAKYAVVVSNGTAALHIACLALGLKAGDQVITSPLTFVASANCALYCQAKPVFADVCAGSANIDPDQIIKMVNSKVKAIIPVHFSGNPCDLAQIDKIRRKHKLMVIEDAAHALGAEYKDEKIGSGRYSDMTILSFHPVKHITTGEGGAVLTNNRKLFEKLAMLRTHGITKSGLKNSPGDWYYQMRALGFNYRITDIQSALGISQLRRLPEFIEKRRYIASVYDRAFLNNPYFDIPVESPGSRCAYHLYPIVLKPAFKKSRPLIFKRLREEGIGVQVHYIPVYWQPYYRGLGYKKGSCPIAENYYLGEVSLPMFYSLTKTQQKYVIEKVLEICGESAKR